MNWINIASTDNRPPLNRNLLCFCEGWNECGYQVAQWNGKKFNYTEQPNKMFDDYVTDWAIFLEAD